MRRTRRCGFTLIELLVVIAIIAILAAMLFPVFARARESARKIQCLSNVKNIAMAFQMYLADYDRLPPRDHTQKFQQWLATGAANFCEDCDQGGSYSCWIPTRSNPYLRWPVLLDEYVRNRDVWRCPSARFVNGATWIVPGPDFVGSMMRHEGESWGAVGGDDFFGGGPCEMAWPTGWGGSVTDSFVQGEARVTAGSVSKAERGFEQNVGTTETTNQELKLAQIDDPSWFVMCGDAGGSSDPGNIANPATLAWPEICMVGGGEGCGNDWENDSSSTWGLDYRLQLTWWSDPNLRKQYTRHLGGSNIGFADGHAAWMSADQIWHDSPGGNSYTGIYEPNRGHLRGMGCLCEY